MKPGDVSVTVYNGSGVAGAAATNSSTLAKAGFRTGTPTTVVARSATTIQYPASQAAQAKLLATYVPGATLESVTGVSGVTLVLGTDGSVAKATASSSASGSGSSGGSSSGGSGSGSSGAGSSSSSSAAAATTDGIPCVN
ncbi:LytR C-terminal domain-containing protein [Frondihabitans sucicola]|uniref:LytR C-terminal domain-containing protein n=1 Tax=Frondihabitans sucicola TaxID=1268041 RepID=UPI002573CCE1|nr:LytR C-terminal domain-containing protein [Frondihabitans sucicola]